MKLAIIILMILLSACGMKQEQKHSNATSDSTNIKKKAPALVITTNKCNQTNLSKQFDLLTDFKRYSDTAEQHDSCLVMVFVKSKSTSEIIDSFSVTSLFYYSDMFTSCDSMTSYTTGYKSNRKVVDNYFGDIVVADLNFDGNDDIAVVTDCSSNGGPFYAYYIQTKENKFVQDRFLTDSMVFFPSKRNIKDKTLTTYVHAGACAIGEHIYKLDRRSNTWIEKRHRIINVCKD